MPCTLTEPNVMATAPTTAPHTYLPGDRVRLVSPAERAGDAPPPDRHTAAFVGHVVRVTNMLDGTTTVTVEFDGRASHDERPVRATVPASYLTPWPPA